MNLQTKDDRDDYRRLGLRENPDKYTSYTFYLWASLAPIQFGTKMLFITSAKCNPIWIIFIENLFMIMTCLLLALMGYCYIGCNNWSLKNYCWKYLKIFYHFKTILLAMISGAFNALANFVIVYAIKLNLKSDGSPGAMNSVLMLNTIICLGTGVYLFNERHSYKQYLGGFTVFIAIIVLTLDRNFELPGFHSIQENLYYFYSILLALLAWCLWAVTGICGKYAVYFFRADPIEYGILAMFIWGITGSFTLILILANDIPFDLERGESAIYTIARIAFAGVFSVTGYLAYFKATSKGSVEVTQLFSNMKSVVQLFEEFLFLNIVPSLVSFIGKSYLWRFWID